MTTDYETVIGLEVPRPARHADQDVLRLPDELRRAAEHADLSRLPGHAGRAAGHQPRGDRVRALDRRWRSTAAINERNRSRGRTTTIRTCRRTTRSASTRSRWPSDGLLEIASATAREDSRVQRLHLEEDAGKLIHEGALETAGRAQVDYNRAGVPLMEIVSQPGSAHPRGGRRVPARPPRHPALPAACATANMEEGSLRCDANVSLRPRGAPSSARRSRSRT